MSHCNFFYVFVFCFLFQIISSLRAKIISSISINFLWPFYHCFSEFLTVGLGFLPSCSPPSSRALSLSVSQRSRKRRNHRRVHSLGVLRPRSGSGTQRRHSHFIGENLITTNWKGDWEMRNVACSWVSIGPATTVFWWVTRTLHHRYVDRT